MTKASKWHPTTEFKPRKGQSTDPQFDRVFATLACVVISAGALIFATILQGRNPLLVLLFILWAFAASYLATSAHNAGRVRYSIFIGATAVLMATAAAIVKFAI